MPNQVPTIGRIVLYTLSKPDAAIITKRRADAAEAPLSDGRQVHAGNRVEAGDVVPLLITRAYGDTPESAINGQAILDGCDTHWVTSATPGDGQWHWQWPQYD